LFCANSSAIPATCRGFLIASQQAKVCAAAVVALLIGGVVNAVPVVSSTCYNFIDDREAAHLASAHRYDPERATMRIVSASSVASAPSAQEAADADAWARNIWADMLT
jgi:hypothetical protein